MKNLLSISILSICFIFFSFQPFSSDFGIPETEIDHPIETYVKTVNNDLLFSNLAKAHPEMFDKVDAVEIHYSDELEYFINILGLKDSNLVNQLVKVSKTTIDNNFVNFEFAKISNELREYCYQTTNPNNCPQFATCSRVTFTSCTNLIICGEWNGTRCIPD